MEVAAPFLPPSNGVVEKENVDVSSESSSSSSSKVTNSWDNKKKKENKARSSSSPCVQRRPNNTFSPSPPPLFPAYPYTCAPAAPPHRHNYYYIPTLVVPPPLSSLAPPSTPLPFWAHNTNYINYTQSSLPYFASSIPPPSPHHQKLTHLRNMITKQIDYYFSDNNLAKDVFLRNRMDDEGWVPITLIAGFRRVSELSNDTQFILDSMMYSDTVEVQGPKLRRRGTWKKWLLPKPPSMN